MTRFALGFLCGVGFSVAAAFIGILRAVFAGSPAMKP